MGEQATCPDSAGGSDIRERSGPAKARTTGGRAARAAGLWQRWLAWFDRREPSENTVLLFFGVTMGLAGAAGVALFYILIDGAFALFYGVVENALPGSAGLHRPVLTGAALFGAWWIMRRLGRGHEGLNVPDVQLAVARRAGHLPARPALARTAASAVTIGGGGSAGSEGPVVVLGAALGSALGRSFGLAPERIRLLVGAGAAAGISAAFGTPLAGAFFAIEQILGSFAAAAFPPVIVASVVAAVVSQILFGAHPAFPIPLDHAPPGSAEVLLLFPLLGVVTAGMGVLFIRSYYGCQDLVGRSGLSPAAIPWAAGAAVGALVLGSGGLLVGTGHLALPPVLFARTAWWILLLIALGKILATSLTLSAGGSGGVFTPCLYIGAATGGAFGVAAEALVPGMVADPEVYALVGMGAVVVAAVDAPLTGILLVFELTNDYAIVVPLMLATAVSHLVARHFQRDSLYATWLRKRGESLDGADVPPLARLRVSAAFEPAEHVIRESETVAELLAHLDAHDHSAFPVVDDEQRVVGVIPMGELGRVARDRADLLDVLLAADVAAPIEPVHPDDPLAATIRRMGVRGLSALPVVDPDTGRLLGMIDRGHVLAAYERTAPVDPRES